MKIVRISRKENIYFVIRRPNLLERLFGKEQTTTKYKDIGRTFINSGATCYVDQTGRSLGNNFGWGSDTREAIDRWRKSFD